VVVRGTGAPRREFLHVADLAAAALFLMERYDEGGIFNVSTGGIAVAELASLVKRVVGYRGELKFDPTQPDGPPRKLLDVGRPHAPGWRHLRQLEDGLARTFRWFIDHAAAARS
jgi:GDP-L-fucose synthase